MFMHTKDTDGIWIRSDTMKGTYGPFVSAYVRNSFIGDFPAQIDISPFPGHRYAIGVGASRAFVLAESGLVRMIGIPENR